MATLIECYFKGDKISIKTALRFRNEKFISRESFKCIYCGNPVTPCKAILSKSAHFRHLSGAKCDHNNERGKNNLRAKHLNTGIKELNFLLTRNERNGIALPLEISGYSPSSTLVIKGPTGKGKSVLASILAKNLHWVDKKIDDESCNNDQILTFCIYFSFTQPSQGLINYLDEILFDLDPGERIREKPYPLIVSPMNPKNIYATDGVAALRRFLLDSIDLLLPKPFAFQENEGCTKAIYLNKNETVQDKLLDWLNSFKSSDVWSCHLKNDIRLMIGKNISSKMDVKIKPIIFIDPINFFFNYSDSRRAVSELFATFRTLQLPLIVILEEGTQSNNFLDSQLARNVEFEADVVIELSELNLSHKRNVIEIKKNRNDQPVFGKHMYRLEKKNHSLSNMLESNWKHPGILIFHSIHNYLSTSRERKVDVKNFRSGIPEFDEIMSEGYRDSGVASGLIPADAFILVRGEKGGHKLSLAFNLLVGLVKNSKVSISQNLTDSGRGASDEPEKFFKNVILVSLGEETSINIKDIALSEDIKSESIEWVKDEIGGDVNQFITDAKQIGSKVIINSWLRFSASNINKCMNNGRLIELNFKPGHLSPEEFLWIIEKAIKKYRPSRLLIENTAHLRMRFPELYDEPMLFPALSSLTHSKQIILIVTDVQGDGSDMKLSYGLAACADYIANVDTIESSKAENIYLKTLNDNKRKGKHNHNKKHNIKRTGSTWSELTVSNIRGKNYLRVPYGMTVDTTKEKNILNLIRHPNYMKNN